MGLEGFERLGGLGGSGGLGGFGGSGGLGRLGSQKVAGEPPRAQKIIGPIASVLIFGSLGLP